MRTLGALVCVVLLAWATPYVEIVVRGTQVGSVAPPPMALLMLMLLGLVVVPAWVVLSRVWRRAFGGHSGSGQRWARGSSSLATQDPGAARGAPTLERGLAVIYAVMLVVAVVRHTVTLYRAERLP